MEYKKLISFPEGFLWGASTSAFQCEGAYDEDGKSKCERELRPVPDNIADFSTTSDHYHRYKEDIALMKEMGFKAYRFSIAWTRIIPNGDGIVNALGVQHYNDVIDECLKNGITPIVTLHHFDIPNCLEERYGGWRSREVIDDFAEYCTVCFKEFGDRVKHWTVNNEYNSFFFDMLNSSFGDKTAGIDDQNALKAGINIAHIKLVAESKVIGICQEMWPDALIGPTVHYEPGYANSSRPEDQLAVDNNDAFRVYLYLDVACKGKYHPLVWRFLEDRDALPDVQPGDMEVIAAHNANWLTLNYYMSATVGYSRLEDESVGMAISQNGGADDMTSYNIQGVVKGYANPHLIRSEFGWEIDAVGLRNALRRLAYRYDLPIIITENGLGAYDKLEEDGSIHDSYRIEYLKNHIAQCRLAINDGVHLIGFCPWSAIDLISTHQGMAKRYGFIYVNRDEHDLKDLGRYRKDSFYWYQKVIESNGEIL